MSARPQLEFLIDPDTSTMTIRRGFAARRQVVWDCYTKSDLLDQWFAPKPFTTRTASMDFREGGHWHYAMVHDGQEFWARMDYQTIRPIDNYTALDGFCDAAGELNPALPRARWDVTFTDQGPHTLVTTVVTYDSPEAIQQVLDMGMKDGLVATLERLDDLLLSMK